MNWRQPFPILPPYHSQFYHHIQVYHPLPNSTTFYHHIPFYHLLHFCYKKIYHPPTLPTTTNSTTFYNHIQFYNLLPFSYKKSTINQLYQLLLILLHSTTISNSTIYCLYATKTTILPYHSQLYHHIQVYHLLPFCYKKLPYYRIIPNSTNSTIY